MHSQPEELGWMFFYAFGAKETKHCWQCQCASCESPSKCCSWKGPLKKKKRIIVVHNILSQQSLFSTTCINFCMVKKWGLWPICKNLNPLWKLAAFVHIWTAMKITLFWALSSPVLFSINITCFLYLQQVVWTLLYDSYTYLSETFVTMVTRRTQTVYKTWASRFTVRLWIWTCFCNIHIPLLG